MGRWGDTGFSTGTVGLAEVRLSDRCIDLDLKRVEGETSHRLTELESRLLQYVISRRAQVVTRDDLLVEVWGYRSGVRSRAPDTLIKQVRKKIEQDPSNPELIQTVYGEGYRWSGPGLAEEMSPLDADWPLRQEGFVGRALEREALLSALRDRAPLVGVIGPSGAGASRLVQEVLAEVKPRVIRLQHGEAEVDPDHLIEQLSGERLVLLDDAPPALIARLAPEARCPLWFTAWSTPEFPGVSLHRLGPMDGAAADALLAMRAAQAGAPSELGTDATRAALLACAGRFPGAIETVAGALARSQPRELLRELQCDPPGWWRGLPVRQGPRVERALRSLGEAARRTLDVILAWPVPVRRELALEATGERGAYLRELEEAGLLATWRSPDGHSRVLVPPTLRGALPDVPRSEQQRLRKPLFRVLLARLESLGPLDAPLLLASAADPSVDDPGAVAMLWSLFDHFDRTGSYGDLHDLASGRQSDPQGRRAALLAAAAVRLGLHDEVEEQGPLATRSDDALVRLRGWSALGASRAIRGDTAGALPAFEAAAAIQVDAGALRLRVSDNLAAARLQLGDYAGGITILEQNVREARRAGGGNRLASVLTNLTNARAASGDTPGALDAGREALLLHEALGDPRMMCFDHANLALALSRTAAVSEARSHIDRAADLLARFDDPRLDAWNGLVELLVRCAEGRSSEARAALAGLLVDGRLALVAPGGGELLHALVRLAESSGEEARDAARVAMAGSPESHGARQLLPSLRWALRRVERSDAVRSSSPDPSA